MGPMWLRLLVCPVPVAVVGRGSTHAQSQGPESISHVEEEEPVLYQRKRFCKRRRLNSSKKRCVEMQKCNLENNLRPETAR